jgi:hypothetical protein
MMFKIYTRCFCLLLSLIFITQANAAIKPPAKIEVVIPFGKDGKINYNLKTGTFNVYQNGQGVF